MNLLQYLYETRNDYLNFMAMSRAAQLEAENNDLRRIIAGQIDAGTEIARLQSLVASLEAAARLMTPRQSPTGPSPRSRPTIYQPSRTAEPPPPSPNFSAPAAPAVVAAPTAPAGPPVDDDGRAMCMCPPSTRAYYRSMPPRCIDCGGVVDASPTIGQLTDWLQDFVDGMSD